ncbi:MAG: DUF2157 domain-containing protein, partial [Cyanobacteria bacterium J055]
MLPPARWRSLSSGESPKPPLVARMLQSFVEELSIRWLLFLGVFMVVVSSGLLAASQWERFPAFAQYAVLWGYTIVFAFVSLWAKRQENLTLTAGTLRIVTLLLVPLNFWAMDGFGLWRSPIGLLTIAVGAFSLTVLSWFFDRVATSKEYRLSSPARSATDVLLSRKQRFLQYCPLLLWLWLSYLHWGWGWLPFPLIAAYQGTIGAAAHLVTTRRQRNRHANPFRTAISLYALTILLGRAVFFAEVPVARLGLAIGICGWLFAFNLQKAEGRGQKVEASLDWLSHWEEPFGVLLMLGGWLVSVETQPAQALAVSALGAIWLSDRLVRKWRKIDLAALYILGIQSLFLIGRAIPSGIRSSAISVGTQLANAQGSPGTLLSLTWFPYLLLMLGVNTWLDRAEKTKLARFGDQFALGFGVFLTAIAAFNPTLRSLNLLLSTATLFIVGRHRYRSSVPLAYLTHLTGLLAIGAIVDWQFPLLSPPGWALVALGAMLAEWAFVGLTPERSQPENNGEQKHPILQIWRGSAWIFGLILAGISYWIGFETLYPDFSAVSPWILAWSAAPLTLTALAAGNTLDRRQISGWLSVLGLIALQILTFSWNALSLISLGIAAIVMLFNTRLLRQTAAAAMTLGFGLCFVGMVLREGILGFPPLSMEGWLLFGAISCASLWLLSSVLFRQGSPLARLYGDAAEGWATALCSLGYPLLTVRSLLVFWGFVEPSVSIAIAISLVFGGTVVRCWSSPSNWGIYCLGWGLELLT